MAGMAPSDISIALLNFVSLSSPFSLANSCTFLVGIWRMIKNLTRSVLATVPSQRKRMLFLVRLKNRRIFSLRSFCLNCNAIQAASFFCFCSRKVKRNLELLQSSKSNGCGGWPSQGTLYRRRNLGKFTAHRVQRRNVKQNEFLSLFTK